METSRLIESKIPDFVLTEVAFDGNLGFQEMFQFYNQASQRKIDELERPIRQKKFREAWRLVQEVIGVKLVGSEFN